MTNLPQDKSTKNVSGIVSSGSNPTGVIYVDSESDITSIVSKLRSEKSKDVKIVVPKNSAALKSGVNLKLLARTAHTKAKILSLITSDSKLIAMASAAKIMTASTLSAIPELIGSPEVDSIQCSVIPNEDLKEDLTIDGEDLDPLSSAEEGALAAAAAKSSKNRKTKAPKKDKKANKDKSDSDTKNLNEQGPEKKQKKIPNFFDFRKKALIGIAAFLSLILILMFIFTLQRTATLEVSANADRLDVNFSAQLDHEASETSKAKLKVAKQSGSKAIQNTTPATGEQNIGSKASGKLTVTNCTDDPVTIPAGTGVSSGGLTYITASSIKVSASDFFSSGSWKNNGKESVNVTAKDAGDQFNSSPRAYTIAGVPSSVSGYGSAMAGGSTQIVKIVTTADVTTLRNKLKSSNESEFKDELKSQFSSDQKVLEDSFSIKIGEEQITPAEGQQADQLSGSVTINYSMYGVDKDQLKKILDLNIESAKKDPDQSIIKDGFEDLKLTPGEGGAYNLTTVAYLGPNLNLDQIKEEVAGKKKGEAIQAVEGIAGVNSVKVKIRPFWSSTLPSKDKIEIKIEVADQQN